MKPLMSGRKALDCPCLDTRKTSLLAAVGLGSGLTPEWQKKWPSHCVTAKKPRSPAGGRDLPVWCSRLWNEQRKTKNEYGSGRCLPQSDPHGAPAHTVLTILPTTVSDTSPRGKARQASTMPWASSSSDTQDLLILRASYCPAVMCTLHTPQPPPRQPTGMPLRPRTSMPRSRCHRPAHRSQLMIGTMEPERDRHIGATP